VTVSWVMMAAMRGFQTVPTATFVGVAVLECDLSSRADEPLHLPTPAGDTETAVSDSIEGDIEGSYGDRNERQSAR
jgi:hypothetical protein